MFIVVSVENSSSDQNIDDTVTTIATNPIYMHVYTIALYFIELTRLLNIQLVASMIQK